MTTVSDRRHLTPVPDNGTTRDLTPPNNQDAERAVLGALLTGNHTALTDVTTTIAAHDHYRPSHELIHDAIEHLWSRGEPVDTITIGDHLQRTQQLDRAGGRAYLAELLTNAPVPETAGYHARIVAEHATRRRVLKLADRLRATALTPGDLDLDDLTTRTTTELAHLPPRIPGVDADTPDDPWAPIDLADLIAHGDMAGPTATLVTRRDGKNLLYPGAIHSISGEPGSGKSWFALVAVAQEITNGHDVLYVDFEDRPQTLIARLRSLKCPDHLITRHVRYIRPHVALDPAAATRLDAHASGTTLAVVDGITEAMTLHGLSLMDNEDVARWLALIPHRLAAHGPAVLQIDHVVKNSDSRGRYAIGGQHKLAGITGAAYKLLTVKSFGKQAHGHAKLVIDKDRHGDIGPNGTTVAELHMDATDLRENAPIRAWLDHPTQSVDDDGHFRPTTLMVRVSDFLAKSNGVSGNAIRTGVRGKKDSIDDAIAALVAEGHIRLEDAPRGGSFHYLVTPFTDDRDED
ncbi:DnaB-like helicase N-terminal domain-containing protein [Janibacter terrae]|uniref:DnaB-like helicase N-terminal domain-containing protein n=1 Tax=Janibacter terrae TaxID=103817 RepID=UPI0008346E60|nr:DnaB-like helicase N-terminal domain-containing protein [Janibacter terrae]